MQSQTAFTLIEMLIALMIAGILAAIALPSLQPIYDSAQDHIVRESLLQDIELAKVTSQTRRVAVSMCLSRDQMTCTEERGNSTIVFLDEHADGVLHDSDQVIAKTTSAFKQGQLHWRAFPRYRSTLLFLPSGLSRCDNGTFWYCHHDRPVWAMMMNQFGRVRTVYPDKNGVIQDALGKPLTCH